MTSKQRRSTIGEQLIEGLKEAIAYERGELADTRTKSVATRTPGEGSVRSYGIVTHEGDQTLVEFPDAPGCQTFADPGEDIHELAQEALFYRCIGTHLAHGEAPPQPSGQRPRAKGGRGYRSYRLAMADLAPHHSGVVRADGVSLLIGPE